MTPNPDPDPKVDFTVRAKAKTANHPWVNEGHSVGYTINGSEGLTLTLIRGVAYVFEIQISGHPFYISSDDTGVGADEIIDGVVGIMKENGLL